jgi:hypothetical protein
VTGLFTLAVCAAWITGFVVFARREYRRRLKEITSHYSRMYGQALPDHSRKRARTDAYTMIFKWPFAMVFGALDWLITSEHLLGVPDSKTDPWSAPEPERDSTDELIEKLDLEIDATALKAAGVRLEDLRKEDPWQWPTEDDDLRREYLVPGTSQQYRESLLNQARQERSRPSTHPEYTSGYVIRTEHPEKIVTFQQMGLCPCGYRTECPVHCGDGSCHEVSPGSTGSVT